MKIDVSALTSHFPNPQDGFTTTTSGAVSSAASTVGLNSTGDYSNGDVVVLIVDPADADKKQVFVGTIDVSGSQVTNVAWVGGTNQAHSSGATIVDYYDAAHVKMMTKGILVHSNQDGTLKDGAVDGAAVLASNVVTTDKILNEAVTPAKWTNPYKFSVYRAAAQSSSSSPAKVTFDTETFDSNSNFAAGTYTAPVAGFYFFTAVAGNTAAGVTPIFAYLYKNGAVAKRGSGAESAATGTYSEVTGLLQLAANDTVEVYFVGGAGSTMGVGADKCYFDGYLVSQT